jgi:hypothetical protein
MAALVHMPVVENAGVVFVPERLHLLFRMKRHMACGVHAPLAPDVVRDAG